MVKKIVPTLAIVSFLAVIGLTESAFAKYKIEGECIAEGATCKIETAAGQIRKINNSEIKKGDFVRLTYDENFTPDWSYDDILIKVEKIDK